MTDPEWEGELHEPYIIGIQKYYRNERLQQYSIKTIIGKTLDNYYFSKGKLSQKVCKDCVRQKEKDKYHSKQDELNEFKQAHPCVKCGWSKFYLIDFHHLNPAEKDFAISDNSHAKIETLMKEIDKCVSLCANCHREFHYLEREKGMTIEEYLGVME